MHEDAFHLGVGRGALDELGVLLGPDVRIDRLVALQHRSGGHVLALALGQAPVRHRREPDVGIEAHLVAGVAARHRAAAGLGQIAHEQAGPAVLLLGFRREALDQIDQLGMAPVAIARQAHRLPRGPVDRERLATGKTALGVEADRARGERRRRLGGAEQVAGGRALGFLGRLAGLPRRWRGRRRGLRFRLLVLRLGRGGFGCRCARRFRRRLCRHGNGDAGCRRLLRVKRQGRAEQRAGSNERRQTHEALRVVLVSKRGGTIRHPCAEKRIRSRAADCLCRNLRCFP